MSQHKLKYLLVMVMLCVTSCSTLTQEDGLKDAKIADELIRTIIFDIESKTTQRDND